MRYRIVTEQYGEFIDVRTHETREAFERDLETLRRMKSFRIIRITELPPVSEANPEGTGRKA